MTTINPTKLRAIRKSKNLTLDGLAHKANVNRQTIWKIENGKCPKSRASVLKQLAEALNVSQHKLTDDNDRHLRKQIYDFDLESSPLNAWIGNAKANALTLVAERYSIPALRIIELAPLLFVFAAEQSLQRRRNTVQQAETALGACENSFYGMRHVTSRFSRYAEEAIWEEERSIDNKDLFGANINDEELAYNFNFEEDAPFVRFLSEITAATDGVEGFEWWAKDESPSYRLDPTEAITWAGDEPELADAIINGHVALQAMPREIRGVGHEGERTVWVRAENAKFEKQNVAINGDELLRELENTEED